MDKNEVKKPVSNRNKDEVKSVSEKSIFRKTKSKATLDTELSSSSTKQSNIIQQRLSSSKRKADNPLDADTENSTSGRKKVASGIIETFISSSSCGTNQRISVSEEKQVPCSQNSRSDVSSSQHIDQDDSNDSTSQQPTSSVTSSKADKLNRKVNAHGSNSTNAVTDDKTSLMTDTKGFLSSTPQSETKIINMTTDYLPSPVTTDSISSHVDKASKYPFREMITPDPTPTVAAGTSIGYTVPCPR